MFSKGIKLVGEEAEEPLIRSSQGGDAKIEGPREDVSIRCLRQVYAEKAESVVGVLFADGSRGTRRK